MNGFSISTPNAPGPSPQRPVYKPLECPHSASGLVRKTNRNGVVVIVQQCWNCGSNIGAVKKATAPDPNTLPPWNESLRERWWERCEENRESFYQNEKAEHDQKWWDWYTNYLNTYAWRERREAVLKRDNHICRGCLTRRAVQVHHLTYDRVGDEMMYDLVSIYKECHERLHPGH